MLMKTPEQGGNPDPENPAPKDPYVFSIKDRTMPDGSKHAQVEWFARIISQQRAGIIVGVRPQSLITPPAFQPVWRRFVWDLYVEMADPHTRMAMINPGHRGNKKQKR